MKAWVFQDHRRKHQLGDKCPWSVGWFENGRKRSKKIGCHSLAVKYARKLEGEAAAGILKPGCRKRWSEFRAEWEKTIAPRMAPSTRQSATETLQHFERIVRPTLVGKIGASTLDEYGAARSLERGKKKGSAVLPTTVNKELRCLKTVLNVAKDWGYLTESPKVRLLRVERKLPRYVTPRHFAMMYDACQLARRPEGQPACDWWRALLTFAYMTGWRIREILYLERADVNLEKQYAVVRAEHNKVRREDIVPLHEIVCDHLRRIASFDPMVFPWPHHERTLWREFCDIQLAGGISLPCTLKHEHTNSCKTYGFHDLRRAFATANAEVLTPDALQSIMRHASYQTTQRYINVARQLNRATGMLFVPEVLRRG